MDQQYKDRENLSKTHLIDKFLDLKFEDDKKILPREREKIVQKLKDEKITDASIAGAIVNKIPFSRISFSTDIYRRKKQVSLGDLKRYIRIEDEVRTCSKNELLSKQKVTANLISSKPDSFRFKKKKTRTTRTRSIIPTMNV